MVWAFRSPKVIGENHLASETHAEHGVRILPQAEYSKRG